MLSEAHRFIAVAAGDCMVCGYTRRLNADGFCEYCVAAAQRHMDRLQLGHLRPIPRSQRHAAVGPLARQWLKALAAALCIVAIVVIFIQLAWAVLRHGGIA